MVFSSALEVSVASDVSSDIDSSSVVDVSEVISTSASTDSSDVASSVVVEVLVELDVVEEDPPPPAIPELLLPLPETTAAGMLAVTSVLTADSLPEVSTAFTL